VRQDVEQLRGARSEMCVAERRKGDPCSITATTMARENSDFRPIDRGATTWYRRA
jgi:hypothetical protein